MLSHPGAVALILMVSLYEFFIGRNGTDSCAI